MIDYISGASTETLERKCVPGNMATGKCGKRFWGNGMKKLQSRVNAEENKYHIVKSGDTLSENCNDIRNILSGNRKVEQTTKSESDLCRSEAADQITG